MRQRILTIGIGLLVLILVVGGGYFVYKKFFGGSGTINVWTFQGNEQALAQVAAIAQKKNPSYKIRIKGLSPQLFEYQSLFALASRKGPDVWILPNEWMEVHRSKLLAAPENVIDGGVQGYERERPKGEEAPALPQKGRTNAQIMTEDYGPIVANDLVKSNQVWGVPLNMDTLAVFYDQSRLNVAPKTWDDIVNVAKNFTSRSGSTINRSAVALGDNETIDYNKDILSILMLQNGVDMVDEKDNVASFNLSKTGRAPEGVLALDYYTSFTRPEKETYSWNKSLGNSLKALNEGKTMVAFGYQSDLAAMTNAKITTAPLPQVRADKPQTYGQYFVATVTKQAALQKKEKAAWEFVSLFANPDLAEQYATTTKSVPARKDLASRMSADVRNKPFFTQVPQAVDWIKKDPTEAEKAFDEAINLVLDDKQSPQIALDVASKKYTAFLQRPLSVSTDPTILTMWQAAEDQTNYKEPISTFIEDNPEVKRIEVSYHKKETYEWELLNVMAAQQGPDILLLPNDWIQRFYTALYAFPKGSFNLSGGTLSDRTALERAFIPAVATDNYIEGALSGMPANIETLMIAYNTRLVNQRAREIEENDSDNDRARRMSSLLDEGPILWSEIKELASILTVKSGANLAMPYIALGTGSNVAHSDDIFAVLVKQFGGDLTDPDRRVAGIHLPASSDDTSVAGQKALSLLKEFSQPQSASYTWNKSQLNSLDALAQGKVMAAFVYPRDIAEIRRKNPTITLSYYALPQLDEAADPIDFASYYSFALPAFSSNPTQALAFVQHIMQNGNDYVSPRRSSEKTPLLERRGVTSPQSIQKNTAISYFKGNYPEDVDQALIDLLDDKLSLDQAAKKINNVLQQTVVEGAK